MKKNVCLNCKQDVTGDSINENYRGMRIHHGQDWYCGSVVEVKEEHLEAILSLFYEEKVRLEYLESLEEKYVLRKMWKKMKY